jgi:hypothetical protein
MKIALLGMLSVTIYGVALGQTTPAPTSAPTTAPQAAPQASVDSSVYTNDELGLSMTHPKNWKQSKVQIKNRTKFNIIDPKSWRPAKVDNTTRFLLPLPGVDEKGVLEIYAVSFNSTTEIWQDSQRDINEQMKKIVLRQWQEELMGVPLLLTKIQSNGKAGTTLTETGIMYSATPRKLVFRLTASPDNFDKADFEFRQAMQTMRTTDGRLPSAEDPDRKLGLSDLNPGSAKKVIWTAPSAPKATPVKGDVTAEATAGGKKLLLRAPSGWKIVKEADGSFTLTSNELSGPAKVSVFSSLDSEPPGKALVKASGQNLETFSKVTKREEKGPFTSRSAANVVSIARVGLAGSKGMGSFEAAGLTGDFYWLLSWKGDDTAMARDRKALDNLVEIMSVDLAP